MKQKIIEKTKKALDELAEAVNEHLFEGCRDWYWVGDRVGGLCCFDEYDFLNVDEMVLILEEDVDYDTYAEWRNAEIDHPEQYINLKSWLMGARYEIINNNTEGK